MRRSLTVLAPLVLSALPAFADPLPVKADEIVRYDIVVRLDPVTKQLHGTERLTWRNPSADTVTDLWFHLYLNAFKNSQSTFFKESGGQLRGDRAADGKWGWIDVTSVKLAGGADLISRMTFERPDDGNAADQTVARLSLPQPIPRGGSVTLDIAFTSQLPQVFARTGFKNDFYLVGQWFPKLGVYEPAGLRGRSEGGWNCHQFHANSEFYADYGFYRVAITAPTAFKLAATGERKHEHTNPDGTTTYEYEQGDIHDFAWTADPHYMVVTDTFSATKDVSPAEYEQTARLLGRSRDEVTLSDVEITVMLQPDHAPQARRHVEAAKAGLKWFGLWYGRYPYKTLVVVDPATGASGAGGMEYPTFITAGTTWLSNRWPFEKLRLLEEVTVHEFGHQFWYAMVGNNEFEEAWLDEGINSYSTGKVMDRVYGDLIDVFNIRMNESDMLRAGNSPRARYNAIIAKAWDYAPSSWYGFYSYQKPELALQTLEGFLGEQVMARVMRTFQERWRFRHPGSQDFFDVVREVAGQDLTWYWDQVFKGTGVLDYAVGSASSERVLATRGVVDGPKGRETMSAEAAATNNAQGESTAPYRTIVIVERRGEVTFPVDVAFKFEGQPAERQQWDGKAPSRTFTFTRPQRLEWVDVDPDRKITLDANWLNNGRRLQGDARAAVRWTTRWLTLVQTILIALGL
jgi:hypothetical protein